METPYSTFAPETSKEYPVPVSAFCCYDNRKNLEFFLGLQNIDWGKTSETVTGIAGVVKAGSSIVKDIRSTKVNNSSSASIGSGSSAPTNTPRSTSTHIQEDVWKKYGLQIAGGGAVLMIILVIVILKKK
jgi:hypothetical protein